MLNKKAGSRVYLYTLAGIVVVLAAYLLIAGSAATPSASTNMQSAGSTDTTSTLSTSQPTGVKLSDTPDWNNAHLISGSSLDNSAQQALSGFSLQKTTNPDGSMTITLKALNPEYSDQQYTVKPGQQLYFIEKSFGDDSPPSGERTTGDDSAVLVDSNGFIVNS
jgi:hypothetical protein